ncbi:MAG: hypothetical protein E7165_00430 [Firmicutes bacterium]|nr:hypothetical protein [Bacillota bacterium]
MKKRGFTLVEMLGIVVVLGIIATIAIPVIQGSINSNREKMLNVVKKQLIDVSKDWSAKNVSSLPEENGESVSVTLKDLKESGLLRIDVGNPKTSKVLSNESFITITKRDNNFVYEVILYDLVDADQVEEGAPTITLNGSQVVNLSIGDVYTESGTLEPDVSIQIIKNGKEVSTIDTSAPCTYSIYYSLVQNDKLGLSIRTVIVK